MDAQFGCHEDIAEERILLEKRDGYSARLSLWGLENKGLLTMSDTFCPLFLYSTWNMDD